ncbi:hypothetical protein GWI33_003367 [Rhynchophorus ferrugineus]|uniref:Myosuppressin n=1 Tax=Rhynchophorus ferrugineus TaxID=354439 RepID=A0A834MPN4_RHYFE|nr:hypothetical protein GWI33_003367 [Rhynchophorus ferrugineus]
MRSNIAAICLTISVFGIIWIPQCLGGVISCDPETYYQDMNSKITQLCLVIEEALNDIETIPQSERYFSRSVNQRRAEKADVRHIILRFGRSELEDFKNN